MSMSIARSKYTGDPGFFDFIKGVAGVATSFIPVVGEGISRRIMSIGRQPPVPVAGPGGINLRPGGFMDLRGSWGDVASRYGMTVKEAQTAQKARGGSSDVSVLQARTRDIPRPGFGAMVERWAPGGATGMMPGPMMNMSGYHANKSDYFLKSGEYVPAGTRMVRNRKRNPANARATSRAISRVVGAKRYAKALSRISIRKKC